MEKIWSSNFRYSEWSNTKKICNQVQDGTSQRNKFGIYTNMFEHKGGNLTAPTGKISPVTANRGQAE
ncbi:hypothetical protein D5R40_21315 [Okeania hirsuta]|uniref:Uncharacterized protein n=1 Tax=Okeania hirsuta TaxID=1458930 RepID=A0A3N6QDQ5_9CYAN|nr:hypothetical protein [Okeania hirsuta]RQH10663.1 hypothetical protein D4Z78_27705 [Okeania hirsuta]RQH33753.1 hypothetical protein D5R40_21315 [Okeania hirsuta]